MDELHLDLVLENLKGPTPELIKVNNQWAAVGLDRYHKDSRAEFEFLIDGDVVKKIIHWNSDFSKSSMKEDKDIANHGGVALAWFVMSVLMDYKYLEQSEIKSGVDYMFSEIEPSDDDLNFFNIEYHHVEVSGILEEKNSNTVAYRLKRKHNQIEAGYNRDKTSSIIITHFKKANTVKERHK